MAKTQLEETTILAFSDRVHGEVLQPGDEGYDEARTVWNAMIDREPAVIAQCTGAADVIAAVDFAREHDLLVSVKGGGHNVAGNAVCDDGLVIDCSPMDSVRVDPDAQIARAEAGATWADFDHETQAFGLATTGGGVSTTGIAGLTLGGGNGFLARKYGLTVDNLRSVDVVTANGELVHASDSEHPDLFWGIRGGGGNFGVVTSFEYDLNEVGPDLLGGRVLYPFEDAKTVLRRYRDFMVDAPDEANCLASLGTAPEEPVLPKEVRGEKVAQLLVIYAGPVANGKSILEPLRSAVEPVVDFVRPQPYTAIQRILTASAEEGYRNYWKSDYLAALPDGAIDTLVDHFDRVPSATSSVFIETMGGVINRVDKGATAFPHRDALVSVTAWSRWTDSEADDRHLTWARELSEAMTPYSTDGVYVNFLSQEGEDRIKAAFGGNYSRLVDIKNEWDPENLFRMNQNIEPTS